MNNSYYTFNRKLLIISMIVAYSVFPFGIILGAPNDADGSGFKIEYYTIYNGKQVATGTYQWSFDSVDGKLRPESVVLINRYLSLIKETIPNKDKKSSNSKVFEYKLKLLDYSTIGNPIPDRPGWKYDELKLITYVEVTQIETMPDGTGSTKVWMDSASDWFRAKGNPYR